MGDGDGTWMEPIGRFWMVLVLLGAYWCLLVLLGASWCFLVVTGGLDGSASLQLVVWVVGIRSPDWWCMSFPGVWVWWIGLDQLPEW